MTPLALQRVAVRMLFDPEFAERVRRDPPAALAGLDATDADVRMLRAPDPRAWDTDPYRRARALKALIEEFPATTALVGVECLDSFFSSNEFHRAVQTGTSLALAFGKRLDVFDAAPMARLESAIARARRAPQGRPAGDGSRYALPRGCTLFTLEAGFVELRGEIVAALGPDPVATIVEGRQPSFPLPRRAPLETLFVLPEGDGARIERIPDALAAALIVVHGDARTRDEVLAALRTGGAEPGDDEEILQELLRDGLLVRV